MSGDVPAVVSNKGRFVLGAVIVVVIVTSFLVKSVINTIHHTSLDSAGFHDIFAFSCACAQICRFFARFRQRHVFQSVQTDIPSSRTVVRKIRDRAPDSWTSR